MKLSKKIVYLLAFLIFIGSLGLFTLSADASEIVPATNKVPFEERYYQLFDVGLTWDEARVHAQSLGGDLVAIRNVATQSFIEKLVQRGNKTEYWLGGYHIATSGANQFRWVTGESMNFTNWWPNEPNNLYYGNGLWENRIVMSANYGRWNDISHMGLC